MNRKLNTEELKKEFHGVNAIKLIDITAFYKKREPDIPQTTVNWRIHSLVQKGEIQRIGKGLYRLGKTELFIPKISYKIKSISQLINKQFPFIRFCQWELFYINYFSQHLINFNILFVDVEKDAVDSVYYALKEQFSKVMLITNLYSDLSDFDNTIFVRPMASDSPIQKIQNSYMATLEKMLVDWATDKELLPFQEKEIYTIIDSACEKYTINQSTMLRYAGRKNKKDKISKILNSINRQ